MLERIILASVRRKGAVVAILGALLTGGLFAALRLPIDALPDVSNVQVTIVTEAPGLSPTDASRMVTTPMELALNGMPGLLEVRSVSPACRCRSSPPSSRTGRTSGSRGSWSPSACER